MNVLVVGGGIMGTSVALELRNRGADVTVLERAVPGAEASSAAGGMLAPQVEAHAPGPFLDLCLRSRSLYPNWVKGLQERTGVDVGYVESGTLKVAFDEASAHTLEAMVAWQKASGLRAEFLDGAGARKVEPLLSGAAVAAAHLLDDAQLDAPRLMKALTVAAAQAGASFRQGHARTVVAEGDRAVGVDLDGEVLRADAVVLAAGSWSSLVAGAKVDPKVVQPVRGQMVELELKRPPFRKLVFGVKGYLVPRADGRVTLGSTMEHAGYARDVTAGGVHAILSNALQLFPTLADAPIVRTWAGLRPWTQDGLPVLGQGPLEQLFLATGHFRNGILLAPITARTVAELVLGQKPQVSVEPWRYARFAAAR